MVDFRDSKAAKRISLTLILTILLEIFAPAVWAIPDPSQQQQRRTISATNDPQPQTRKKQQSVDPLVAKVLPRIGRNGSAAALPEDNRLQGLLPDPSIPLIADIPQPDGTPTPSSDPVPASEAPTASPSPTADPEAEGGQNKTVEQDEGKKRPPKTVFSVPGYKAPEPVWGWEDAASKPNSSQQDSEGHSSRHKPGGTGSRDDDGLRVPCNHEQDDRDDEEHGGVSTTQLAYLKANPNAVDPGFKYSRQTEPGGRFYEMSAKQAFSTDYLINVGNTVTNLTSDERLILDFTAPVGAKIQNKTARNTAASAEYHYQRLAGSTSSSMDSRYRLTVTEWSAQYPHGHTWHKEESMWLSKLRMLASCAMRAQGDWTVTLTRNGSIVSTDTVTIADPPVPAEQGWARRVNGAYQTPNPALTAWTNDEMVVYRADIPLPAPTAGNQTQSFTARWDLRGSDASVNKSNKHSYWSLEKTYVTDGSVYNTTTTVYDPIYRSGLVWQQTSGNGTLSTLPVAFGRGLPVAGTWTLTRQSDGSAAQTSSLNVLGLEASVKPITPSYFLDGTLPLQANFQAHPSSYVPTNLNWTVKINDASGQTLRSITGNFTNNSDNAKTWIVPWDGKDSNGVVVPNGTTINPVISVGIPVDTAAASPASALRRSVAPGSPVTLAAVRPNEGGIVLPQAYTLTLSGVGAAEHPQAVVYDWVTGAFVGALTNLTGSQLETTLHFLSDSREFYILTSLEGPNASEVCSIKDEIAETTVDFGGTPNLNQRGPFDFNPDFTEFFGGDPAIPPAVLANLGPFFILNIGNLSSFLSTHQDLPLIYQTLNTPNSQIWAHQTFLVSGQLTGNLFREIHVAFNSAVNTVSIDVLALSDSTSESAIVCTSCECSGLCKLLKILQQWGWLSSPIPIQVSNTSGRFSHHFTDLAIPTKGRPLVISRLHSSDEEKMAPSFGWTWSFQDQLLIEPTTGVVYHRNVGGGDYDRFDLQGSSYVADGDNTDVLTKVDNRHYKITTKSHMQMIYEVASGVAPADLPFVANIKQEIDNNGNTNTLTWDSTGKRMTRMEGPDPSQFLSLQWSDDRGPDKVTDYTGRSVVYRYQKFERPDAADGTEGANDWLLAKVVQPGNKVYQHSYHKVYGQRRYQLLGTALNGILQEKVIVNPDYPGVLQEVSHRLGATYAFSRDNSGPTPTTMVTLSAADLSQMPGGQKQTYTYTMDSANRVTSVSDVQHRTESVIYDSNHNVKSSQDLLGHVSTQTFDSRNNPLTSTDSLGRITKFQWVNDDLVAVTDAKNQTSTLDYNQNHDVVAATDPLGHRSTMTRNSFGKPVVVTDSLQHSWTLSYNPLGFLNGITAPPAGPGLPAAHTIFSVDNLGRRVATQDPLGRIVRVRFDERNRVRETTIPAVSEHFRQEELPAGHVTAEFDNNDLLQSTKALDGLVTSYDYDSANKLVAVHQPGMKLPTRLKYDAMENVVEMIGTSNHSTKYQFDALNRVVAVFYPGGSSESYQYDNNNNIKTWNRGSYTVSYTYDVLDRLEHLSSPTTHDDIQLGYDELDRVSSMTDNSGTTTYGYTNNYLLDSVNHPGNKALHYFYDNGDRLIGQSDAENVATTYGYSDRNELTSVSHDGQTVGYQHDLVGRTVTAQYPNGVTCQQSFSERNQLLYRNYTHGANPLMTLKYAFNQVGQRTVDERNDQTGTVLRRFRYNQRRELIHSERKTCKGESESDYAFDQNHNLVRKNGQVFQSNAEDELIRADATTLAYNAAGQANNVGPDSLDFAYNGQIKAVHAPGVEATYLYDGNGQRVQKTVNGVVQKFLWNGGNIAKEYRADGSVRADYQLGAGAKIEGKWQFYLSDIQGSTYGVADDQGHMIASWSYSDYGETTQTSGDKNLYQPFLYTHQEQDAETGWYHLRARHYSPKLSKFLARDPIGYGGGSNQFAYCSGDSINRVDPSGLIGPFIVVYEGAVLTAEILEAPAVVETFATVGTASMDLAGEVALETGIKFRYIAALLLGGGAASSRFAGPSPLDNVTEPVSGPGQFPPTENLPPGYKPASNINPFHTYAGQGAKSGRQMDEGNVNRLCDQNGLSREAAAQWSKVFGKQDIEDIGGTREEAEVHYYTHPQVKGPVEPWFKWFTDESPY